MFMLFTDKLVAISDQPRIPDLQMPFGNSKRDYELGVVIHINKDHLTYVFDLNAYFRKKDIIFKVLFSIHLMLISWFLSVC